MTLPETAITQIMNARHLLFMAKDNIESHQKIRQFAGVNLLHDAAEAILLAVDFQKGNAKTPHEFVALFDHVDTLLGGVKLPFRSQIVQLNKLRVSSKHYAITPYRNETNRLLISIAEFMKVVTEEAFGVNFDTVNLVDLVDDEGAKEAISNAIVGFENVQRFSLGGAAHRSPRGGSAIGIRAGK
jgi:hypothetical protein